jgi:transcriptional regulator with XRE-family HTH domain
MRTRRHTFRNLRHYFAFSGVTQQEFARHLGLTQSYLSYLVNGKRTASLPTAIRIASLADIPVETLIAAPVPPTDEAA